MASPAPGGGNPIMPRQPRLTNKRQPVVDPIVPGGGKPKRPRPPRKGPNPGLDFPNPGLNPRPIIGPQPFPGPRPYAPIKQTKAVNKVYKTY